MTDFKIVPDSLRELRTNEGRPAKPEHLALLEGKTVFVSLNGRTVHEISNRARSFTNRHHLRLRTVQTEQDGVHGLVMWAVSA